MTFFQSFYFLTKKLIQTFAPGFLTIREWLYIDTLIPVLLPTIETSSIIQAFQNGRLNSDIYNVSKRSIENEVDLSSLIGHFINAKRLESSFVRQGTFPGGKLTIH